MRAGKSRNIGMWVLFILTGAVLGGVLGEFIAGASALSGIAPYLVKTFPILDVAPAHINLYVMEVTVGFTFHPSLISMLGMAGAAFLYYRF